MGAFQLDTSGSVRRPQANVDSAGRANWLWSDLTPFTQGYVEALLRSLGWSDANGEPGGHKDYAAFSDLAPETLARIIEDCTEFTGRAFTFAETAEAGSQCWAMQQARWPGYSGQAVLRGRFPPLTPYLGDDGKVYLRESTSNPQPTKEPGQ